MFSLFYTQLTLVGVETCEVLQYSLWEISTTNCEKNSFLGQNILCPEPSHIFKKEFFQSPFRCWRVSEGRPTVDNWNYLVWSPTRLPPSWDFCQDYGPPYSQQPATRQPPASRDGDAGFIHNNIVLVGRQTDTLDIQRIPPSQYNKYNNDKMPLWNLIENRPRLSTSISLQSINRNHRWFNLM